MAFTAETGSLPPEAWLLFIANLLWTVAYDTYYAMADRDDDLKIGIKSTAILFGEADRVIIVTLQGLALFCLLLAGVRFELGQWFHLGLVIAAGCFAWEFWKTQSRKPQVCFKAFLHNHWRAWRFSPASCWITRRRPEQNATIEGNLSCSGLPSACHMAAIFPLSNAERQERTRGVTMNGKSILIVDDEAPIREMIVVALEMAGYDCLEAENTQQAHALIIDRKPDLILLDWMLPGTSASNWRDGSSATS